MEEEKKDLFCLKTVRQAASCVDGDNLEKLLDVIEEKVVNNVSFFQGYDLVLKYKGRQLTLTGRRYMQVFNEAGASVMKLVRENCIKSCRTRI